MKQKSGGAKTKNKQGRFQKRDLVFIIFFMSIFLAVLPLVVMSFYGLKSCNNNCGVFQSGGNIKVSLDKDSYNIGEKISLGIINSSDKAIYLEPCEQINVFEKKVNGEWILMGEANNNKSLGQSDGFEKKSSNTSCQIGVPEYGSGIYRLVVPVFYNCSQANRYACEESEIFYSKSFEISVFEETCDETVGDCDGEMVSISGTLEKVNDAYYLSNAAGYRDMIKLVNLASFPDLELEESGIYDVEGIFHKSSEVCADLGNCVVDYSAPSLDLQNIKLVK
jgi:hypothetical protein